MSGLAGLVISEAMPKLAPEVPCATCPGSVTGLLI